MKVALHLRVRKPNGVEREELRNFFIHNNNGLTTRIVFLFVCVERSELV